MKVYKDDRGEHDLERKIEQLELKIRTYQELMKDTKSLKFKITELESEIIKKDNLIEGMKKIIDDLSMKI
jgi:chaperonin cofactor prefoldin